jgi:aerobic carbon-monoxide dehydrogenase small subunit
MSDDPEALIPLRLTVNGERVSRAVPARRNLVDFLRVDLGLTGSHVGCEHGVCGTCSVVVAGEVVRGCLVFAVQLEGKTVETIEGASESGRLKKLQDAFYDRAALQCGYCTAGMLLTAAELLAHNPHPSRAEIREYLSGNYCRCTGYQAIVDAIEAASKNA